jgi:hypothetical protein
MAGTINRSPTRAAALLATDELALKFLGKVWCGFGVSGRDVWALGVRFSTDFSVCFLTIE